MPKRHRETTVIGDLTVVELAPIKASVPHVEHPGGAPVFLKPDVTDPAPVVAEEPIDAPPPVSETAKRGDTKRTHPNPSRH